MYSKLDRANIAKVQHNTSTPNSSTRGNVYVKDGSATVYFKDQSSGAWFTAGGSGGGVGIFEEGSGSSSAQRIDQSLDATATSSFLMGGSLTISPTSGYSFIFGFSHSCTNSVYVAMFGKDQTFGDSSSYSFAAGSGNTLNDSSSSAVFGFNNTIESNTNGSFVAGYNHIINADSLYSLAFGYNGTIGISSPYSIVLGRNNQIGNSSQVSFCAGYQNQIENSSIYSFVAGISNSIEGTGNTVFGFSCALTASNYNFIAGESITLNSGAEYNAIFGNTINVTKDHNIVAGESNTLNGNNNACFGRANSLSGDYNILAGYNHTVSSSSSYCSISGYNNSIINVSYSVIGGTTHTIDSTTGDGIFGGSHQYTGTSYNIIAGYNNTVSNGTYCAIFGTANVAAVTTTGMLVAGANNVVTANYSFCVGSNNVITTDFPYSSVMGKEASAIFKGGLSFAGDSIDGTTAGNSQCMTNVPIIAQTVGAVTEVLKFDLSDSESPLYIRDGYAQSFRVSLLAADEGTSGIQLFDFPVIVWRNDPVFKGQLNNGSIIAEIASPTGTLAVQVSGNLDATNFALEINVTGEVGKTINYVGNVYAGCQCETGCTSAC